MNDEVIRQREIEFQLYEVLDTQSLCQRERFAEHSRETFDAALTTAHKMARELFAPHNAKADSQEPTFDGDKVSMLPEVKVAFDAFAKAGFIAGRYDYEEGGMQLPEAIMTACCGYFTAANPSTNSYSFLTTAATNVVRTFASQEIKDLFYTSMLSGRFTGTMALTEPHAGSSLADITTSATPTDDGSYRIKGSKIYISAGEHELSENIVHLVLAKIKGGPPGVKGISLFVVPKYRVNENGDIGARNDVVLAGLIHKLGNRGTTSTALTFGDNDDCHGYLVGEPHQGLKYMFLMMNEARLAVGFGAAMLGYKGYLYSLDYAKERPQGRLAPNLKPTDPPVPIIEHGDVKRMLLAQKAYAEGSISLCFFATRLLDDVHTAETEEQRENASLLLDLLTPVVKSWPSEYGTKANDLAIQVLGGAGYTREYPVEQCWRDNRLNAIHEGTNGIQALDLLTRKLWLQNGEGLNLLKQQIMQDFAKASGPLSQSLVDKVAVYLPKLQNIIAALAIAMQGKDLPAVLSNAQGFMNVFGNIVIGWIWIRQAIVAERQLSTDKELTASEQMYYQGKQQAAKYFITWVLPTIEHDLALLEALDDICSTMQGDWF